MTQKRKKFKRVGFLRIATEFEPKTFGRLTTIGPAFTLPNPTTGKPVPFQVCECSCGNVKVFAATNLGKTSRSCGCYRDDRIRETCEIHGRTRTTEYSTWGKMRDGCYRPTNNMYQYYGAKGIKVCDRWLEPDGRGFMNFFEDMGPKPSPKHSIDRIDITGDYCPENCKWATDREQANNKSNNHWITIDGKRDTLANWCRHYGIGEKTFRYRIRKWKCDEKTALTVVSRKSSVIPQDGDTGDMRIIEFNGVKDSVKNWAAKCGMEYYNVYTRIFTHGWSVEKALTTPIRQRKKPNT